MARDWGQWAALFDPSRALGPDEIGALYQPRLRAPHAEIARRLSRARPEHGLKAVILGSRGSGKSTELARLAHVVRDRCLAVRVDLAGAFDAGSSVVDLLVLLAASVERTARDWERPQTASRRALAQAVARLGIAADDFGQLVAALEPVAAVAGAPGGAAAASVVIRTVGTLTRKVLGPLVRDGAAADQGALIAALNAATLDLRVSGDNDHPVLFLLEGLDKLTELATIRSAFRDVDLLLMCVAGWTTTPRFTDRVMRAFTPRSILLSHWDDFLSPMSAGARMLPAMQLPRLVEGLTRVDPSVRLGALPLLGSIAL